MKYLLLFTYIQFDEWPPVIIPELSAIGHFFTISCLNFHNEGPRMPLWVADQRTLIGSIEEFSCWVQQST